MLRSSSRRLASALGPLDIPPELSASLPLRRKRLLRWATQRGMKENDILLGSYAIQHIKDMSDRDVDDFELILNSEDPDIFLWLTGKQQPADPAILESPLLAALKKHTASNPLQYNVANKKQ